MIQPAFLSALNVLKVGDGWKLSAPLRYRSGVLGAQFEVPTGFTTDLASVPRLPLAFWLAGDTAHEAAVIHDWLYQVHLCSRAQADAIFYEAMQITGVPSWRRWLMWSAVRAGGHWAWYIGPRRYSDLKNHLVTDRRATKR